LFQTKILTERIRKPGNFHLILMTIMGHEEAGGQ